MILNATLPGATFNKHSCTMKYKVTPQNRWTQRWRPARQAWAAGQKVVKLIGFDCDETYRMKRADARAHSGRTDPRDQQRYEYQFPLMEWGYSLGRCLQLIDDAGLPIPFKASCGNDHGGLTSCAKATYNAWSAIAAVPRLTFGDDHESAPPAYRRASCSSGILGRWRGRR